MNVDSVSIMSYIISQNCVNVPIHSITQDPRSAGDLGLDEDGVGHLLDGRQRVGYPARPEAVPQC